MTLDELIAKLPDSLKPIAAQYGPGVLAMSAEAAKQWLDYVFVGRYTDAYALYLSASGKSDLLAEFQKADADWKAANVDNAAKIAMANKIAQAIAQVMLGLVLAAVGL